MRELNSLPFSPIRQISVKSISRMVCTQIVGRIKPFFFEFAPQCLGNVQMWRIGRQKEQIQPPCFVNSVFFLSFIAFVLCMRALSNTTNVFCCISKENLSKKSKINSVLIFSLVTLYRQSLCLFTNPKQLNL